MDVARFEAHVLAALDSLPDDLASRVQNVAVVAADRNPDDPDIYGLYTGTPLTERSAFDAPGMPDTVEIYREPLVADFGHDPSRLEHEIRVTVLHELAHFFGIGEDRLAELGWD